MNEMPKLEIVDSFEHFPTKEEVIFLMDVEFGCLFEVNEITSVVTEVTTDKSDNQGLKAYELRAPSAGEGEESISLFYTRNYLGECAVDMTTNYPTSPDEYFQRSVSVPLFKYKDGKFERIYTEIRPGTFTVVS